jgi:galactose mutarotase-like enzyme
MAAIAASGIVELSLARPADAIDSVAFGRTTENVAVELYTLRYGNRIALGRFGLNGISYSLATNNGPNALHGGRAGFDKVIWQVAKAQVTPGGPQLTLKYLSRDGEEGYPGNLSVTAVYTLTLENALRLEYSATTDRGTVVNLTQHSYFSLRGCGDILGHIAHLQQPVQEPRWKPAVFRRLTDAHNPDV